MGIQPYAEFIAALAGTYTDREGVQHQAFQNAVKVARRGYFDEIPPLTEAQGYRKWAERVFGREPECGHKLCPDCYTASPHDSKGSRRE